MKLLYIPVPSTEVGKKLAYALLEKKLAFCCNISEKVESIYWFKGTIHEDNEYILFVKTFNAQEAAQEVEKIHPYEVPVIVTLESSLNISNPLA